ncbi:hypothetical protein J2T13_002919 [Paenibacillus sp. DS2015]|uniref:hypothetical protein n=1 Tax=Paenibacillus sp. DS2015 TaxID=3373917 RepID=UPI003D2196FF
MEQIAPFVVVLVLLIAVGWILIKTTKTPSTNSRLLRWTGYGLILLTFVLIVFGVLHYFDAETHRRGH